VRIRSEHAIGFLKGRFQSLKGLHVSIKDTKTHQFATYWVAAFVSVHSFAMQCEDEDAVMADRELPKMEILYFSIVVFILLLLQVGKKP
jgi:hypothetical protein